MTSDAVARFRNERVAGGYKWLWIEKDGAAWWAEPSADWSAPKQRPGEKHVGGLAKQGDKLPFNDRDREGYYLAAAVQVIRRKPHRDEIKKVDYVFPTKSSRTLFIDFASMESSPVEILKFANNWGLLSKEHHLAFLKSHAAGRGTEVLVVEPAETWINNVNWFLNMVAMWVAAARGNEDYLKDKIYWENKRSVRWIAMIGRHSARPPIAIDVPDLQYDAHWLKDLKFGDLCGPAAIHVVKSLNRQLEGNLSPFVELDPRKIEASWNLKPTCLLAALTLQFAQHICGGSKIVTCTVCQKWFDKGPFAGRKDKIYCSEACKMRAYRSKKK